MKHSPGTNSCTAPRYAANGNAALLVWGEGHAWCGGSASVIDFGFDGWHAAGRSFPASGGCGLALPRRERPLPLAPGNGHRDHEEGAVFLGATTGASAVHRTLSLRRLQGGDRWFQPELVRPRIRVESIL